MALWILLIITGRLLRGILDGAPLSDWVPQVTAELLFLAAILIWPRTRADWLPKALVGCQMLVIYALMLTDDYPEGQLGHALGFFIAVLYTGIWWRGWLSFAVAAFGSAMYLHASTRLGLGEEIDDVWFGLTFTLFGVALGIHVLSGQIDRQLSHDALTGTLNRRALDQYLARDEWSGRVSAHRSLVSLDLDGFKDVNDEHGHIAGDSLLCECVSAWRRLLPSDGLLFRIGGDEFLLILGSTDPGAAAALIEQLRASTPIAVSIGIASWPTDVAFDQAFHEADKNMFADKARHRSARGGL